MLCVCVCVTKHECNYRSDSIPDIGNIISSAVFLIVPISVSFHSFSRHVKLNCKNSKRFFFVFSCWFLCYHCNINYNCSGSPHSILSLHWFCIQNHHILFALCCRTHRKSTGVCCRCYCCTLSMDVENIFPAHCVEMAQRFRARWVNILSHFYHIPEFYICENILLNIIKFLNYIFLIDIWVNQIFVFMQKKIVFFKTLYDVHEGATCFCLRNIIFDQ